LCAIFSDTATPGRKTFTSRPRTDGLWVRLRFIDNDVLEGLMANDLTQVIPEDFSSPRRTHAATRKGSFVPRTALQELNILAVIGRPEAHKKPLKIFARKSCLASHNDFALTFPFFPLQSRF